MNANTNTTGASMMAMSDMLMVFYTSTTTPLYSTSWMPSGRGQYAGTCIFIIVLATLFRSLFAIKSFQERKWLDAEVNRRYIGPSMEKLRERNSLNNGIQSAAGTGEDSSAVVRKGTGVRPWRISTDVPRAVMDTFIVGVGYLL